MNDLVTLSFEEQTVRVVPGPDGEPRWLLADVCTAAGIGNASLAARRLNADDLSSAKVIDAMGREQAMLAVNESGLYDLLLNSRRPEARRFRRWITSDVVPSIRRTGAYSMPNREAISEVDRLAGLVNAILPGIAGNMAALSTSQQALAERVDVLAERQRITDPQEIERRVKELHEIKKRLVHATEGSADPVTYRRFWEVINEVMGIASIQHRAALDIPTIERGRDHAVRWCQERGVPVPTLIGSTSLREVK